MTTRKIQAISNVICDFLNKKNDIYCKRKRKINTTDTVLSLDYYKTMVEQELATIQVNKFKHKDLQSTRTALIYKENNLPRSCYTELHELISSQINHTLSECKYSRVRIAVDGTYTVLLKSLGDEGFMVHNGRQYTSVLDNLDFLM